ncbi:MAG: ribosomal large subunit pseudouridine synthase F, partial [Cytophagales bacterium]|nr:ribosomal large subunit pseudouridine synthase F [Cytophagales bacterium]
MTFRNRVQYLLVHSLMISNREAQELLVAGKVIVNGQVQMENMEITPSDEVYVGDRIIQHALVFKYIAYYKPRGVESTLNAQIPENLLNLLPFTERVYPIGRLDKESEGLLILTNDGDLYNTIIKQE